MTVLKFTGVVEFYSDTIDTAMGEVLIGERNVVREILESEEKGAFKGKVTVALADERFNGDLYALQGLDGYSEWTPGSPAELIVGAHNLLLTLHRYEDMVVTLWIADEPINTLEDSNEGNHDEP